MTRLPNEPKISGSSSYYDRAMAENAVSQALDANQSAISTWLNGSAGRPRIDYTLPDPVGISVSRGATSAIDVNSTRTILVRDPSMLNWISNSYGIPDNTMTFQKLDALEQLLVCYLHQDWQHEFDDDAAALQAILEAEPSEQIAAGVGEIDVLLAAELTENDLRMILVDQVGCYFDPNSEGLTYKQWLGRVRSALLGR
jgi:hypothetical protein